MVACNKMEFCTCVDASEGRLICACVCFFVVLFVLGFLFVYTYLNESC